jgi:hypothetical protein
LDRREITYQEFRYDGFSLEVTLGIEVIGLVDEKDAARGFFDLLSKFF